ncbi:MAG: substrate-binding domain-containing protein [Abditibacteriota bacterium]|nr:substrate-binding domain-containing protein [Abditibacteriota bacterium]
MKRIIALFALAAAVIALVGCGGGTKKVVLITMDSSDRHWVSVDAGAREEADELEGVEYKWMAPDKKDDAQQIERINNAVADGAAAILIAVNGPDAVTAALKDAQSQGVKIIYVDSPANLKAEAIFATDNEKAGRIAGEEMLKGLKEAGIEKGKIGIVSVNPSIVSTSLREKGFRSVVEKAGYEILPTQFGEGETAKSQDIADNYISEGCAGIYATNEGCAVGTGNAVKSSGKKVVAVGFDKSDTILALVKDGSLRCVMAQNPEVMGRMAMEAAGKLLKGETIENTDVDTGVSVINKENLKD